MKTLFKKLKPEVAELLKFQNEINPAVTQDLINELQSKYFWTELKVKDAYSLVRLDQEKKFSIYELIECFENEN